DIRQTLNSHGKHVQGSVFAEPFRRITMQRESPMGYLKGLTAAFAGAFLMIAVAPALATGNADGMVKIGVLGDMSGVYATGFSGPGAVAAVKLAVKDFGGKVLGKPIQVVSADHQNKPDVASAKARKWIDDGK